METELRELIVATAHTMEALFERGSKEQLAALSALRDELRRLGFYCEKARATEDTLRAYPVRRHVLPLLNPRFVRPSGPADGEGRSPTLEVAVLSKGVPGLATRLLSFPPSPACRFEHVPAMEGAYRRHGHFVIQLALTPHGPEVPSEALRSIHDCLAAPRRPA